MSLEGKIVAVIGYVRIIAVFKNTFSDPIARAGITGLQTSIALRQAGYSVFLIAKHYPSDRSIEYTSPW
jgi:hypothetical protein